MLNKIITICFYFLFALTPLLWSPFNFELFEYNKMMFVYLLTLTITFTWILKMLKSKSLILRSTPLDLPLLLFLVANILSTIFSIDQHTSIWGYYSRSNGGLLSLISYLLLYKALVSNFERDQALNFLKAAIFGGVLVSLWAIPEHFGVSISCLFLTGNFNASCWVQDVQARVFATLGQPNWLAAYLGMLIFPTIYFLLTSKQKLSIILYSSFIILFYLAFTFTYSRGAMVGFVVGLGVFILTQILALHPKGVILKHLVFIGSLILIINLLFGSALTNFKLVNKFSPPPRPSLSQVSGTQLESGGTESGSIRLIVWQGAIDIFKHYPVFGSGVETFAYAYYQFRPMSHNLVSEWDFLYNKAHNEYLNYLATTGLVGFLSYFIIIITSIIFILKNLKPTTVLISTAILASYISYLVQNIFSFSVVIIALFFYLFPALLFIITDSIKTPAWPKLVISYLSPVTSHFRKPFYSKLVQTLIFIIFFLTTFNLFRFYLADTFFALGMKYSDTNPGRAYNELSRAYALNPNESYYQSELSYVSSAASVNLANSDATLSARLKDQTIQETENILKNHPKNVPFFRTAIRTYYLLSTLDPTYIAKTLEALNQAIKLSPTDPKLTYNKAIILASTKKTKEAILALDQTIKMKPNYKEAYFTLADLYLALDDKEKAREVMENEMKYFPNDPDAINKLKEIDK